MSQLHWRDWTFSGRNIVSTSFNFPDIPMASLGCQYPWIDIFREKTVLQFLNHLDSRVKVHKEAVKFCEDILRRKSVDWVPVLRDSVSEPICDVDMVITIGGDGTVLHASHFVDDTIPLLGVNSDPTQDEEVEKFNDSFDASRSTGYLCAATVSNFEQVLDGILEGRKEPHELSRVGIRVNNHILSKCGLNDILISHPCPASVSRFSFKIMACGEPIYPMVNSRSSGLRVSSAAGSTAAMLSAGGFQMSVSSQDLQYMVREPILSRASNASLMHGFIKSGQSMHVTWYNEDGIIYIDGSHVKRSVRHGDAIEISCKAPPLKVFLRQHSLA
ncbi:NADH kinase-like isoform X2 [Papaver somniferum]|nr:NADH kinase-like isoform X2 [Papaver somniferum]